jgi:hypothetical protein
VGVYKLFECVGVSVSVLCVQCLGSTVSVHRVLSSNVSVQCGFACC